jgi:hypothetical protein
LGLSPQIAKADAAPETAPETAVDSLAARHRTASLVSGDGGKQISRSETLQFRGRISVGGNSAVDVGCQKRCKEKSDGVIAWGGRTDQK